MNFSSKQFQMGKKIGGRPANIIVNEPYEILKSARGQIIPEKKVQIDAGMPRPVEKTALAGDTAAAESKFKDQRRINDLKQELKQIDLDSLIGQLQQKIAKGEVVYLEDYPNIPIEQRQVLKAQMEAYQKRMQMENQKRVLEIPMSKPSRKMGEALRGMKGKLESIKRKAEIRMPPSG